MEEASKKSLQRVFAGIEDPRMDRTKRHQLEDIILIAILAVICGAEGWVDIEAFGKAKEEWLKTFLALPNGIPSHDTFGRVFARIDAQQFEQCFLSWVQSLNEKISGVVAIDGKTLRRSHDRGKGKKALHLVSAWASEARLVLGQVAVEEKSNEITAIPELLELLVLEGCIVTIDAMGTQWAIAAQIIEQKGDYVLALKENQGSLYAYRSLISTEVVKNLRRGSYRSLGATPTKPTPVAEGQKEQSDGVVSDAVPPEWSR
jgi:predicted transposase YbfD/YdcC